MTLTTDHLPFGLARLGFELRPLAFHPRQFTDHGEAYRVIADAERSRHPHPPVRRVKSQVQVLDVLPNDFDPHAPDHHVMLLSTHSGSSRVPDRKSTRLNSRHRCISYD